MSPNVGQNNPESRPRPQCHTSADHFQYAIRRATTRLLTLFLIIAAAPLLIGCSSRPPVTVEYVFTNVDSQDLSRQLAPIRSALESHAVSVAQVWPNAARDPVQQPPASQRQTRGSNNNNDGETKERRGLFDAIFGSPSPNDRNEPPPIDPDRQRQAQRDAAGPRGLGPNDAMFIVAVNSLKDLEKIDRELTKLDTRSNPRERVPIGRPRVNLAYGSAFVSGNIQYTASGRTAVGNRLELSHFDSSGSVITENADRFGRWQAPVRMGPGHRYIYGRSSPPPNTAGPILYFRIDTQNQASAYEPLTERQWRRATGN